MRKTPQHQSALFLLLVEGAVFFASGCVSSNPPHPSSEYSATAIESTLASEAKSSRPNSEVLQQFMKDGQLCLTLDNCIDVALARNFNVRLANEALVQAKADIVQARAALLPFIGTEASYSRLDEELGFGPMTFMDRDIYKAGLVVRQPVFTGGRLDAAHKAARYLRDARVQDKRTVEKDIIFQVTRTYRISQVAETFQKVATEAVTLLETHEHDVGILVREGAVPELDLLRTRTELANARKELNAADNALDIAFSALKNLLVVDLETPVYLTGHLGRPLGPTDNLGTLTQIAVSHRPELSSLKSQVAAAEQGFKAAKGEHLPTIALEGRHEYMEGDYRDLDGGEHWTVGVGVQLPIWNWDQTSAKVRKARSQLSQARIQLRKTEDGIRLEVRQAFLNLGKAEKNITVAEAALKIAEEAFRQARVRYQEGEGTNTDVLDARTALSRAEANHAQALFEYNVALAALQRAMGTTDIEKEIHKRKAPTK